VLQHFWELKNKLSKGFNSQNEYAIFCFGIATQELDRTNQNQKYEGRREAPPLIFLVLCSKQNLRCYIMQA
jgi:hypothetical protein